jgi:hypothetical protein
MPQREQKRQKSADIAARQTEADCCCAAMQKLRPARVHVTVYSHARIQ